MNVALGDLHMLFARRTRQTCEQKRLHLFFPKVIKHKKEEEYLSHIFNALYYKNYSALDYIDEFVYLTHSSCVTINLENVTLCSFLKDIVSVILKFIKGEPLDNIHVFDDFFRISREKDYRLDSILFFLKGHFTKNIDYYIKAIHFRNSYQKIYFENKRFKKVDEKVINLLLKCGLYDKAYYHLTFHDFELKEKVMFYFPFSKVSWSENRKLLSILERLNNYKLDLLSISQFEKKEDAKAYVVEQLFLD